MPLSSGARLGAYEVTSHIGSGGMGEVYQAHDSKLGRDVAIKVLPAQFARDPERLARFQREAKMLAALNHPNIATIHGLEQSGNTHYLVMELVPGDTLAQRIRVGAIPLDEALPIARQVADAVEYAHDKNVIHRDLKPANIKVTPEGTVKVLDFGLAKALVDEALDADFSSAPTLSVASTQPGAILGTAAYMSPEQARGQAVDKRTDIWAFGAVFYELLTGRPAFHGATFSDTIAAVLEREPDWAALPLNSPPAVERLLRRCLEKNINRRLHHAADARIELEDLIHLPDPRASAVPGPAAPRGIARMLIAAVAIMGAMLASVAVTLYLRRVPDSAPATRLSLSAPGQVTAQSAPAVSPDGRRVAFVAADESGRPMLWIQELDSQEPRLLADTEDAAHPFWSPDGRAIGFLAGGKLKRVDTSGGAVLTLSETAARSGGSWSPNGMILFLPRPGQIATVPATGGPIVPVIDADGLRWPSFLPDGEHFLFVGEDDRHSRGVYVGRLGSTETKRLMTSTFEAAYAPPGYLVFLRGEALMAQPFDAQRLQLTGEPELAAEGIWGSAGASRASFSVSQTGVLAYTNASLQDTQLVWFDRSGQSLGVVGPPARLSDARPQLSPDGKRIAIARGPDGEEDIWLFDLTNHAGSRLTLTAGSERSPVWSPDGHQVAFQAGSQPAKLMVKDVDPIGPEMALTDVASGLMLCDWSRDGQFLIYSAAGSSGFNDLWVLPLTGDRKDRVLVHSDTGHIVQAQISPNRRWVAYTSYESGKDEVYAVSFPTPNIKRQISSNGGVQPRWRADGTELFYVSVDKTLMAVPILNQETLQVSPPKALFQTKLIAQGSQSTGLFTLYDVARDGQRFLMNVDPDDPGPPFTVVLNWTAGLKK